MSSATIEAGDLQRVARKAGQREAREREAGARRAWLAGAFRRRLAGIGSERRIRRGIQELKALDDHLLDDIGLRRDEIEPFARHGRPGRPSDHHEERHHEERHHGERHDRR